MKRCDVTGYDCIDASIRSCPHPSVVAKYGRNGKCNVSYMVCRKCRFAVRCEFDSGIKCCYGQKQA